MSERGRLFLIPTPLGNLGDLAPRSRELLESVGALFCEDTRTTSRLLAKLELKSPTLVALHDHNERQRVAAVLDRLERGDVGMVSEAGTPVLSDPGYVVVRAAIEAGFEVISVPGPSAAVAAVVGSGLPVDRFVFAGFPPRQSGKRRAWLAELAAERSTLVLYEAPRRIVGLLEDLEAELGDRPVALAVNLSKLGERFVRGSASAVATVLRAEDEVRGEMTLVVGGFEGGEDDALWERAEGVMTGLLEAGTPAGAVRDAVCAAFGLPRREVYQRILELQG
ncbi:MAG: 16S rRNA (cytidine(1402)-2'-O)-methyltransferase [Alphaproteobacteria bacterium]|nr:16S rRNA (cytidine(1402)-2'-O)-methyltransferase [Alphaproteobacteria bacterium]